MSQLQKLLAGVLQRRLGSERQEFLRRLATRRLRRIEDARFYHWKSLNLLAPKRLCQQE